MVKLLKKKMELYEYIDGQDERLDERIKELDEQLTDAEAPFELLNFVRENLEELDMNALKNNAVRLLYIACAHHHSDKHKINEEIGKHFKKHNTQLLTQFVTELSEMISTDIPVDDRREQLKQFGELLTTQEEVQIVHPAVPVLDNFRSKTRAVTWVSNLHVGLVFLLSSQPNFKKKLSQNTYVERVARKAYELTDEQSVEDWLHVIDYFENEIDETKLRQSALYRTWLNYCTIDPATTSVSRFLQLFVSYHSKKNEIWTRAGWRQSRVERHNVQRFKATNKEPFNECISVNEMFELV